MRKEYDLQTDVLATIVAATSFTKNHSDLLTAFATRTDYRSARYVMTRDVYSERPARILDAEDREIAADYHAWIDAQLEAHGGSVRAVWEAYRNAGYRLTEIRPLLHYFVHDRGGEQDNFVQLEVWEEQEFVERELFPRDDSWGLPRIDELRRGATGMAFIERIEPRMVGTPRYRLEGAIDMLQFTALATAMYDRRRRADGDRRLVETNSSTGEQRIVTVRELTPGYDQVRWSGRRFFDDWSASSAGRAGHRACLRWTFNTSDYTDPSGKRELSFVPQWAHTRKIAELKNTGKLDVYSLYGKLTQFDERIGMPFAWYFYGLHGNLVKSGQMERVLEAAEDGLIVLPEHDYQVLRRWSQNPYGF
ncbi:MULTISPECIES: hypothetical protein [Caballeronia]|uniref:hypothetical protein n=1 Tax=Caballeronia TaxID=1827195 RepID=UPI00052F24F7|nr:MULTISPECIES: hypothetical protein [Caballeronia]MCE4547886.1 hypothetical protein [Caballeronia sp. PC1]MCE4575560.1 hypothetical protein [Caballeronia sp. CLC5]